MLTEGRYLRIQTVDNCSVSGIVPFKVNQEAIIYKVFEALKSAIGKTLDDAGKISS